MGAQQTSPRGHSADMDRKKKRELRDRNSRAWAGERDLCKLAPSLDSSLKKNTAFIKRVRTGLGPTALPTFLQEISSLSLQKYLSEIISATYEGLSKLKTPSEVAAAVEVVSALHQRFGPADFTCYLGWLIGRGLSSPDKSQLKTLPQDAREKEEKERLARHRVLLKVATELWLVGVLRSLDDVARPEDAAVPGKEKATTGTGKLAEATTKGKAGGRSTAAEAEPFALEALKDILSVDRDHANISIAVLFAKTFSYDVLGVKTTVEKGRRTADGDAGVPETFDGEVVTSGDEEAVASEAVDPPLVTPEMQQRFKNVLTRYLDSVKAHVLKDQKAIFNQGKRNAEAYVRSGEIFEDRQANYDKQIKAQEKLVANMQTLCEILDSEIPDLGDKEATESTTVGSIGLIKTGEYLRGQGEGAGIWEDEEERRFYENLIDLKDRVPGVLLEDAKKKKTDNEEQVGKRADQSADPVKEVEKPTEAADDQSTAIANKTVGAQVDGLLTRLPEMQNKDAADQIAVDFCFLNSKASRNRLIKAVQEPPKGRMDLLPLYARLITTVGKYMTDITTGIVSYLDDEFRSLQRRKSKDFLGQVRTSNIRYLAELTKFGVVPEHVIFHCLKVALDDFSRMNMEIIANLLENCGRYLLRNPDTSPRMKSFFDTLQRKKAAHHLAQNERMMLENAMYYVNPPERAAIQQKERMPTELYIRQLVYLDLNKRTYPKVLKTIRKLHWEEAEVVQMLERIFSKPGKVKYSSIFLLAMLVQSLSRYHQDFVITVIDNLVEQITLGLEQNDFKFNQKRIAEVKYLGELYNFKVVDSPLIFDTLYRIVCFGQPSGTPAPSQINPLDLPDDYFRIRLVCNLVETCGVCFDRGTSKKKLDFFLTFFQYYIFTKDKMPMDIDFLLQDTLHAVAPHMRPLTDLEEAARAFADAVSKEYKMEEPEKVIEQEEPEDIDSSDGEGAEEPPVPEMDEEQASSDDAEAEVATPPNAKGDLLIVRQNGVNEESKYDSDFEEDIVVTRPEEERNPEAEAEFDRELAKMMAESIDSRKLDRKAGFDIPLPMRKTAKEMANATDEIGIDNTPTAAPPSTMAFSLMTKKGNKQQTRTIELPSDSSFAVAMRSQQEAERAEQQRIKNLVLNYDLQSTADQDGIFPLKNSSSSFYTSSNPNLRPTWHIPRRSHYTRNNAHAHSSEHKVLGNGDRYYNASLQQPSQQHHGSSKGERGPMKSGQRARKLQFSDVDWYGPVPTPTPDSEKDAGGVGGARDLSPHGRSGHSCRPARRGLRHFQRS